MPGLSYKHWPSSDNFHSNYACLSIILFNLHLCFYCRLADLVGLTKLVIGGNIFSEGKLPGVVYELKNLRELFLAGSGLVEIDERYGTDHQRTFALK